MCIRDSVSDTCYVEVQGLQLYSIHSPEDYIRTSRYVNEARGGFILAVGRVRSKKKKVEKRNTKKSTPPTKHHVSRSSPATATISRRRAKKHVPRVSPYSPASIDTGFVEIGIVQLSQSAKRTNINFTHRQIK